MDRHAAVAPQARLRAVAEEADSAEPAGSAQGPTESVPVPSRIDFKISGQCPMASLQQTQQ